MAVSSWIQIGGTFGQVVLSFADPNGDIASESGYSKPDMEMPSLLRKILMWDLIKGLSVTFRYQHPKEIYTEQYPLEQRT